MKLTLKRLAITLFFSSLTTGAFASTTFAPYADLTINMVNGQPSDLSAISKATGIKRFHLAFITNAVNGVCSPAWGGQQQLPIGWGKDSLNNWRNNGIGYVISLGGATGNDISKFCPLQDLTNAYQNIINTYNPIGLDFDIEGNPTTAYIPNIMSALQTIQKNNPGLKISFTIAAFPEPSPSIQPPSLAQQVINQAYTAGLHFSVNIMAMDYGLYYNKNDAATNAIYAATNIFNFLKTLYPSASNNDLWQMIQVTPMIGANDIAGENPFTTSSADTVSQFAIKNNLAGLNLWSIARDNPCPAGSPVGQSSPVCSGTVNSNGSIQNYQTMSYEFSKHLLGNLGQ